MFADDMKLFMSDLNEIKMVSDVIKNFEHISGLRMHRDARSNKCQALPFGKHRRFSDWPDWVAVKDQIKIVGALFTNIGSLEKINSDLVMKNFFDTLNKSHGIKGTIIQKVYVVNTYLFSKAWVFRLMF